MKGHEEGHEGSVGKIQKAFMSFMPSWRFMSFVLHDFTRRASAFRTRPMNFQTSAVPSRQAG
jgi:hypothetical protein